MKFLILKGHELKGLISYFNCGLEDLNVPLSKALKNE